MHRLQILKASATRIGVGLVVGISLLSGNACANQIGQVISETISLAGWSGGKLQLHVNRPQTLKNDLPVVIVIPGAKRNAKEYSQYWLPLVRRFPLITVTIECDLKQCPTEYHYNLGGYKLEDGSSPATQQQFFQVPELAFSQLQQHFHLSTKSFYLFGHSAGGTFAHLYPLMRPQAPVKGVVAANPAFFMVPDANTPYPFGLKNSGFTDSQIANWLATPTALMLGDRDLNPRTKALSNSPLAQQQGLAVFSRGLYFFSHVVDWTLTAGQQTGWKLVVADGVGHDAGEMAPYAFEHWFSGLESAQ